MDAPRLRDVLDGITVGVAVLAPIGAIVAATAAAVRPPLPGLVTGTSRARAR